MIPQFPAFAKLDLSHKSLVDEFFRHFPAYSEFGFANMFVWDTAKPVMISLLNDNLIIQFMDFKTQKYYLSLIGGNKIDNTIQNLIHYSLNNDLHPALSTVPEYVVSQINDKTLLEIAEEQDNSDYIISVPLLADLKGNEIADKRHKVNQFNDKHQLNAAFKSLDLGDPETVKQMRAIMEKWFAPKKHLPGSSFEFAAIDKALKNHKDLDIEAYGVYINDVLEAFTMVEKVHDHTVIGHFEKANREHTGIYEYMNHMLCRHLQSDGFEYLNICQDLGDHGLRNAKMSYRPVRFHKKYIVKHRTKSAATS